MGQSSCSSPSNDLPYTSLQHSESEIATPDTDDVHPEQFDDVIEPGQDDDVDDNGAETDSDSSDIELEDLGLTSEAIERALAATSRR